MVKGASLSHLTLLITCNLCVTTRGLHAIPRNTSRNHSGIFAEIPRNYAQYPRNFADLSCRVVLLLVVVLVSVFLCSGLYFLNRMGISSRTVLFVWLCSLSL